MPSRPFFALILCPLLLLAGSETLAAQTVSGLSTDGGTIGTEFVITGSGFGPEQPKAWLVPEGQAKGKRLKVLSWSSTSVTVRVRGAKPGMCDLHVRPGAKGAATIVVPGAFEVRLPSLTSVNPTFALPKGVVVLAGDDFGTRKPRIRIGGRKAKVLTWTQDSATVRLSKKVPAPAVVDVSLRNKLGEVEIDNALNVMEGGTGSSSLGDTVFCDLDGDGVEDPGEPGIEGVLLTLVCAGADGILGTADDTSQTTTTDSNGKYLFSGLSPDICEISVDPTSAGPDKVLGDCPETIGGMVHPNVDFLDADFCFVIAGQIGDTVFCDLDDDGIQSDGEPGLQGIGVELVCAGDDDLLGTADDVLLQTVTDADGHYLFGSLEPGACQVSLDDATAPADKVLGECPASYLVDLGVGESFLEADFCYVTPGEIGDSVFCDLDGNGVQDDGEPGIEGVLIELRCPGADGLLGTADDPLSTQLTDADGKYLFSSVTPDTCEVSVDVSTAPAGKSLGNCPSEYIVQLGPDDSFLGADFCFVTPGEVGDTVFSDVDGDGVQDDGEPGIENVVVELAHAGADGVHGTADDLSGLAVTDQDGHYLFGDLPPGQLTVSIDPLAPPFGMQLGVCPASIDIQLASGESFLAADFCFEPVGGSIGDLVFCDENDDGVHDDGEPGIPGVRIKLTCAGIDDKVGTDDDLTLIAKTASDGSYLFEPVPPGLCRIEVDTATAPDDKVLGACPAVIMIDLPAGGSFLDADFCFTAPASGMVGDSVFCDLDGDGSQDDDEPGIEGVLVELRSTGPDGQFGTGDDYFADQSTDEDGRYLFTAVPDGLCVVSVDPSTAPDDKVPGSCPTDVACMLAPGGSNLDVDFCFTEPLGEIGDTVWCDLDDDGERDDDEPGLEGVEVRLTCAGPDEVVGTDDDTVAYETTDAQGHYLFEDVQPGICIVQVKVSTAPFGKVLGDCPATYVLDLDAGQSFLDADFCFIDETIIAGKVYCVGDDNGNGGWSEWDDDDDGGDDDDDGSGGGGDGGPYGLEGVEVRLTCAGPDDVIGTDDDEVSTQLTDQNGNYMFSGVASGLCLVQVVGSTLPDGAVPSDDCPPKYALYVDPGEVFLSADFCYECDGGGSGDEGCSQGYWKQSQHFDSWPDEYSPNTPFDDVFEDAFPGMSLLDVLWQGGGQLNALGRKTVAALLNAANDDVDYKYGKNQVIDKFNDVYPNGDYNGLKDDFESANNEGCPLN